MPSANHHTHWNYRVVDLEKGEALVLVEVYYNKKKIVNYCALQRSPLGTSMHEKWNTKASRAAALKDLRGELKKMQLALKLPIIKMSRLAKLPCLPF
jgi:hypothetical protein